MKKISECYKSKGATDECEIYDVSLSFDKEEVHVDAKNGGICYEEYDNSIEYQEYKLEEQELSTIILSYKVVKRI